MKKLEWNFYQKINDEDNLIDLFLEKHNKRNNCWWSQLNPYLFGKGKVKDFFHWVHKKKFAGEQNIPESFHSVGTAKVCPAIGKGILDKSFLLKTPTDLCFSIDSNGYIAQSIMESEIAITANQGHSPNQYKYNWDYRDDSITDIVDSPFDGYTSVKFGLPIYIRTNNVPYIFLQPQYHKQQEYNENISVLNGLVEGKYTGGQPLLLNVMVKLPKSGTKTIFIKQGTVLAYLWSPEYLELVRNKNLTGQHLMSWTIPKSTNNIDDV